MSNKKTKKTVFEDRLDEAVLKSKRKNNKCHRIAIRYGHEILRLRNEKNYTFQMISDWYCKEHGRRFTEKFFRQVTAAAGDLLQESP